MRPLTDECALARQVCVVVEGSDDVAKLGLLLDTHEEPTTSSEEERREKKAAAARAGTTVKREVDRIAREYFVRVWWKRGQLLGGVPSLDNRVYKMVFGALIIIIMISDVVTPYTGLRYKMVFGALIIIIMI